MWNYLMLITGGILFLGGYYFMKKTMHTVGTFRIYAIATYAGFCLLIAGGTSFFDGLLESAAGDYAGAIRTGIQVLLFMIGAELFLKPAFEDKEEEKKNKKSNLSKYSGGASAKPIRKKSSKKSGGKAVNRTSYQKVNQQKTKNNPKKKK